MGVEPSHVQTEKRWLVHVARECMPLLRASGVVLHEELGEDVRLVCRGARDESLPTPLAALFRYRLPIVLEQPIGAHRSFAPTEHVVALRNALELSSVRFVQVAGLRRATERLAEALEVALCQTLELPSSATHRDDSGLLVAIGQDRLFAGVASPRLTGGWDVLQRSARRTLREWPEEAVSRAGMKWVESKDIFRLYALDPDAVRHWLELGAAPGGITRVLSETAHVTAVDKAPLDAGVAARPRVRFLQGDARTVHVDAAFGGLICDINGTPHVALAAVERFLPQLSPGALLAITLKLPTWESVTPVVERACAALAARGAEVLTVRHLLSHRREVALFAQLPS